MGAACLDLTPDRFGTIRSVRGGSSGRMHSMRHASELPNIARLGALIGNPVRARFIGALMDGGERAAGELAALVGATPQTASAHLASLVAGGLLTVRPQGRHRFYRLRSEQVAAAIEVLSLTAAEVAPHPGVGQDIRSARRCYDHLAGRLGVAICAFAVGRRFVIAGGEGVTLTPAGGRWLASLRLEPPAQSRRPLVRFCQDWTERRPHLAGWLGAALCRHLEEQDVIRRSSGSRAMTVTATGRAVLARLFGVHSRQLDGSAGAAEAHLAGAERNASAMAK
jgi:DNA-binding transcriptional ArsR family regulator